MGGRPYKITRSAGGHGSGDVPHWRTLYAQTDRSQRRSTSMYFIVYRVYILTGILTGNLYCLVVGPTANTVPTRL